MRLKILLTTIATCFFFCSSVLAYTFQPFSDLDSLTKRSEFIVLAEVASLGQDKDKSGNHFMDGLVKYEVIVLHNIRGSLPLNRHPVILQSDFIRKYHIFRQRSMALLFLTNQGSIGGKKVLMNTPNSGSIMPASPDLDVKKLKGLSEKEQILFVLNDYIEFKKDELRKLEAELPLPKKDVKSVKKNYVEMSEDIEIMSRVIDRTLKEKYKEMYYSSMLFGGIGCRGVYLKNHGTLFFMNVKFPVAEGRPQFLGRENNLGLWEQTEQEVRNTPASNQLQLQYSAQNIVNLPYDAKRVNELKEELTRIIGDYASNISQLRRQDVITLVIFGAALPVIQQGDTLVMNNTIRPKPNSTLIIKIKKIDLDAHKAGKMDFKGFLKQAEVVQY